MTLYSPVCAMWLSYPAAFSPVHPAIDLSNPLLSLKHWESRSDWLHPLTGVHKIVLIVISLLSITQARECKGSVPSGKIRGAWETLPKPIGERNAYAIDACFYVIWCMHVARKGRVSNCACSPINLHSMFFNPKVLQKLLLPAWHHEVVLIELAARQFTYVNGQS